MHNDTEVLNGEQANLDKMTLNELFAYQQIKHQEWIKELEKIRQDTLISFFSLAGIYE